MRADDWRRAVHCLSKVVRDTLLTDAETTLTKVKESGQPGRETAPNRARGAAAPVPPQNAHTRF